MHARRTTELKHSPPGRVLAYRALISMFGAVFGKTDPQFNLRWLTPLNSLGLSYQLSIAQLHTVTSFADTDAGSFVVQGGRGEEVG